ncbi:cell division protein FtsQ/DivIB [Propionibacteriaceae bacterium Y1685]
MSRSEESRSRRRTEVRPVRGAVINDMGERLAERRRRGRRRILVSVVATLATLLVLGGAVFVVGFSPWMTVRQVNVTGTSMLTEDQVRQAAAIPLDGPLVRVDTDAAAERIRGLAPVSDVKVVRKWPHTVTVQVTERVGAFVVEQKSSTGGKEYLVVDASGTPYTTVPTKPKGMVTAEVIDPALLDDLGAVVTALPEDLAKKTTMIEAYSADSIVLTVDKKQVIWGSAERSDLKAQVVVALMKKKGKVYDVSAPDFPAVK